MPETAAEAKPKTGEQTGGQALVSVVWGPEPQPLANPLPAKYSTYRAMRKHPTIALARAMMLAPILAGSWSVNAEDGVDDEIKDFIAEQFLQKREQIMEPAMYSQIDFGWQPFEKVYEARGNVLELVKIKPLLQDLTAILVLAKNGAFAGFRQTPYLSGTSSDLALNKSFLIAFRVEGTNWYGQALMENAREQYNEWRDSNEGAARYDRKIAGAHYVVKYPAGNSTVEGVLTKNTEIAKTILNSLCASGSVMVPNMGPGIGETAEADQVGWVIEILEDKAARQPTFIDRLRYLDTCLCRALLMPERSITEGQFGTKAEAEAHADFALTNLELADRTITRHVNWHCVDHVLALNYGEEARGTIWLEAAPLTDVMRQFLKQVYIQILTNPSGFLEEFRTIDTDALKDQLEIPKAQEPEQGEAPPEGLPPEILAILAKLKPGVTAQDIGEGSGSGTGSELGLSLDNPYHVPAGQETGGQFTSGPSGGGGISVGRSTAHEKDIVTRTRKTNREHGAFYDSKTGRLLKEIKGSRTQLVMEPPASGRYRTTHTHLIPHGFSKPDIVSLACSPRADSSTVIDSEGTRYTLTKNRDFKTVSIEKVLDSNNRNGKRLSGVYWAAKARGATKAEAQKRYAESVTKAIAKDLRLKYERENP